MPTSIGTLSQLTIPVMNESTGEVTNKTYDLPSGGSSSDVSVIRTGQGSSTSPSYQEIVVDSTAYYIDGATYFETSTSSVSSGVETFTFTNSTIFTWPNLVISEIDCDVYGVNPISVVLSGNTLSVSFNSSDNVSKCRVYLRDVPYII